MSNANKLKYSLPTFMVIATIVLICNTIDASTEIAKAGNAKAVIAIGENPFSAETTAEKELVTYLKQITGAPKFMVVGEEKIPKGKAVIYLGDTTYARKHGVDISKLGDDESVIKTVNGNLILAGGRPRGTLYAVYRFLEKLGVTWLTMDSEVVPEKPNLTVGNLDIRTKPVFALRDIATDLPNRVSWNKEQQLAFQKFLVRNRLNGPYATRDVYWKHGKKPNSTYFLPSGDIYGGSPYLLQGGAHTFWFEVPNAPYFEQHPEWFSMRNGKRVKQTPSNGNHLCITNPKLRKFFAEQLLQHMRNNPKHKVFCVGMNDGGSGRSVCDCPKCKAFIANSSDADLWFDFINYLAKYCEKEFPDNKIWTMSYNFVKHPPKKVKVHKNVIVRVCDLHSDAVVPLENEKNTVFGRGLKNISAWSSTVPNLEVWDYAMFPPYPSLSPTWFRTQEQAQFCKKLGNVTGYFAENYIDHNKYNIIPEFYRMNVWLFAKMLENPDQDIWPLIKRFMNGYYGKAGSILVKLIKMEYDNRDKWPTRMVTLNFVKKMQQFYDEAEAAVKDKPKYLKRVKKARLWADFTTLAFRSQLIKEFLNSGNNLDNYPFKSADIKKRLLNNLKFCEHDPLWTMKTHRFRQAPMWKYSLLDRARQYVDQLTQGKEITPLPIRFSCYNPNDIIDISGVDIGISQQRENGVMPNKKVKDKNSITGIAAMRFANDELPLKFGIYDHDIKKNALAGQIRKAEIPGPGYNIYYLGKCYIPLHAVFYLTKRWRISYHGLGAYHNPADMNCQWKVYASIKFTGPAYPFGNNQDKNAVYIDRLILVKANTKKQSAKKEKKVTLKFQNN